MEFVDVPGTVLKRLRRVCLALPEAEEAPAWVGRYFRIRRRTFVHVFAVDHPDRGPTPMIVCRADPEERDVLLQIGGRYYAPGWGTNTLGVVLVDDVDWTEVAELVTESYLIMAPKKLGAQVRRSTSSA